MFEIIVYGVLTTALVYAGYISLWPQDLESTK
jgi:hypothetical protein